MQSYAPLLQFAHHHAQAAQFEQMRALCMTLVAQHGDEVDALLDAGVLLLQFGFLADAQACFERVTMLAPDDLRGLINLANVARDAGAHQQARACYANLAPRHADHPVVRRNTLIGLEYDLAASDADRLAQAIAWGQWAKARAGGARQRPPHALRSNRPLRVGYVSADFCQHTVGLFVKDVIAAHDPARVQVFAYHAGGVDDWVTQGIRQTVQLRDVASVDDAALAALIRADAIDVLVDLSGHTAGSRLTVFAHRPAPVQVSWLGYFATTGLDYMDAVLLDAVHAPPGTESQFVEPVYRLPAGRLCYQPVPFAGEVAPLPAASRAGVSFGSFNNTAKYNAAVHALWAKILTAVPGSRLVLKWRSFNDEAYCRSVLAHYAANGIAPDRITLRKPSFHVDLLKEYADIDIALDPFPFCGGLTSCEALWMGVPVITLPQSRVVSRQSAAFLSAIGLSDFVATDAEDYVRIAVRAAADLPALATLRSGMRERMQRSPLMDVATFTRGLEDAFIALAG